MQAGNSKCAPSPFAGFVALCCAVYFTSYLTRKCFEASMLAICDATGLARSAAGLAGMAAVALYGSGQFVTGWLADERKAALALFAAGFACAVALFVSGGGASVAVGLPLLAILSASMHGANLMLVCELPGRFAREGCVGTVSGILNAGVYVGAALSVFGFPALREHHSGWGIVFGLWVVVLALGMGLLSFSLPRRRRKDY